MLNKIDDDDNEDDNNYDDDDDDYNNNKRKSFGISTYIVRKPTDFSL